MSSVDIFNRINSILTKESPEEQEARKLRDGIAKLFNFNDDLNVGENVGYSEEILTLMGEGNMLSTERQEQTVNPLLLAKIRAPHRSIYDISNPDDKELPRCISSVTLSRAKSHNQISSGPLQPLLPIKKSSTDKPGICSC